MANTEGNSNRFSVDIQADFVELQNVADESIWFLSRNVRGRDPYWLQFVALEIPSVMAYSPRLQSSPTLKWPRSIPGV